MAPLISVSEPELIRRTSPEAKGEGIAAFAKLLANACPTPLPEFIHFHTKIESYGTVDHYTTNPSDPFAPEFVVSHHQTILSYTSLRIDRSFFSQHFLPPDEDLERPASFSTYEIPKSILNKLPFGDSLFWYGSDVLGKKIEIYLWKKDFFCLSDVSGQEMKADADPLINQLIELYPDLNAPAVYDCNDDDLTHEIDQRILRNHGRAFFEDLLHACHIQPKDWRITPMK